MNLRPFASLAFSAALLLGVAACSKSGSDDAAGSGEQLTVGFAQTGAESAWRTAETESVQAEANAAPGADFELCWTALFALLAVRLYHRERLAVSPTLAASPVPRCTRCSTNVRLSPGGACSCSFPVTRSAPWPTTTT